MALMAAILKGGGGCFGESCLGESSLGEECRNIFIECQHAMSYFWNGSKVGIFERLCTGDGPSLFNSTG